MGGSGRTRAAEREHRSTGDVQDLGVECGAAQACWCQCLRTVSPVLGQGHHASRLCSTVLVLQLMISGNALEKGCCEGLKIVLDRSVLTLLLLSPCQCPLFALIFLLELNTVSVVVMDLHFFSFSFHCIQKKRFLVSDDHNVFLLCELH